MAVCRGRGRGNAVFCALGDQAPLEVGDCSGHVKYQFSGGRGGVDLLLKSEQRDAAFLQHRDRCEQFCE
jgi:hypothetical protein